MDFSETVQFKGAVARILETGVAKDLRTFLYQGYAAQVADVLGNENLHDEDWLEEAGLVLPSHELPRLPPLEVEALVALAREYETLRTDFYFGPGEVCLQDLLNKVLELDPMKEGDRDIHPLRIVATLRSSSLPWGWSNGDWDCVWEELKAHARSEDLVPIGSMPWASAMWFRKKEPQVSDLAWLRPVKI